MKLLRLTAALLLLKSGNALLSIGSAVLAEAKAESRLHPVERLLLGSICGTAVCGLWIAATWRAWQ
ncbi:hypothetical protein NTH_04035 [Nitratireductor thuwali]|uniref:Uncharacterized protein n=1 Tax=Nitratireductor thuwali TaxID=2267699 RepID=A0ABY5MPY8_9HYPH|nr:hypothetical protein NTH_04035 [Nitratireductor thuwali]